ncbi:MAG: HrcA family transcriptional regulator, partial [Dehalococcoidia bacterium]
QEQLTRLAARLNAEFGGLAASQVVAREQTGEPLSELEGKIIAQVTELLLRGQQALSEPPVVEGIRDMLRQPEFGNADRVLDTLEAVDERHLPTAIPTEAIGPGDVAVVIGDENREGPYQDMSFVLSRYGVAGGPSGVLGILGPTRMPYSDTVAHVRYVADVLTELMREFYGEE